MAPETPGRENGGSAYRTRLWPGRAIVLALLTLLVGEIALETSSRISYHKSLDTLQERLRSAEQSRQILSFADAEKQIVGLPATSEKMIGLDVQREYRWRSFLWDLRIQMLRRADGALGALTTGPDASPPPWSHAMAGGFASPQFRGEIPLRIPRGLSARSGLTVAVDLKGTGFDPQSAEQGYLLRELVRQSLLIAARDELGLPTRDRVLGDAVPDDNEAMLPILNLTTSIDAQHQVRVV